MYDNTDQQATPDVRYEYTPRARGRSFAVPFAIMVAGLFIGAAIFFTQSGPGQLASVGSLDGEAGKTVPALSLSDHVLGNPDAPIVIIEYSDTECPFCKTFHETMHRVIEEYGSSGDVAWVYRHFPLKTIHSKAPEEAAATECAAELGGNNAFWRYLDKIFETTASNNTLDLSLLPSFAATIGLNGQAFEQCIASGRYKAAMEKAFNDALEAGASGTPTSFLLFNGQQIPIPGSQSFSSIANVIDELLRQMNKSAEAVAVP